MKDILSEFTPDKAKTAAEAVLAAAKDQASDMPDIAKKKFIAVAENAKNAKVVSDLLTDVEKNPEKVKREIGIAGIAAALTFVGIRFFDSHSKSKHQD